MRRTKFGRGCASPWTADRIERDRIAHGTAAKDQESRMARSRRDSRADAPRNEAVVAPRSACLGDKAKPAARIGPRLRTAPPVAPGRQRFPRMEGSAVMTINKA